VTENNNSSGIPTESQEMVRPPMAFEPSTQNQQSLGLGSYILAGAGVAIGVTLVSAVLGAF